MKEETKVPDENQLEQAKIKERRAKREYKRLDKLFEKLEEDKKKIALKLIQNLAFMAVEMEDLQKNIHLFGCVATYQNGENQFGTKKSPEIEIYNTTFKNYANGIKQLTDLLPKAPPKEVEEDEFEKY